MIKHIKNIAGFSDTVSLFQKRFPGGKGSEMFKLGKLGHDFLQIATNEKFREAIYDVKILENLANEFLKI